MTAEDQIILKRRLRDAELMLTIVRLERAEVQELVEAVFFWDDEDIQFANTTRMGRAIVERYDAIPSQQIGEWVEGGDPWE